MTYDIRGESALRSDPCAILEEKIWTRRKQQRTAANQRASPIDAQLQTINVSEDVPKYEQQCIFTLWNIWFVNRGKAAPTADRNNALADRAEALFLK